MAWLLTVLPLLVLLRSGQWSATTTVVVVALTIVQITCLRFVRSTVALAAVVAAGAAALPVVGVPVSIASVVLAFAWSWGLGVRPARGSSVSTRSLKGLAVVATFVSVIGAPPVLLVLIGAILIVVAGPFEPPGWAGAGIRFGDRFGAAAATVLGAVAMVIPGAVVSLLWAAYRCVGHRPLGCPSAGWVPRVDRSPGPSPHGSAPRASGPTIARGRRFVGHALVIVVLGFGVGAAYSARATSVPSSAAFADDPGWPTVWREQSAFNANPRYDNTTLFGLHDFRSRFVNQRNQVRTTWRPPQCSCRRFTVWWFGGSAAWGFYQRDDDTIPSRLARDLWARGIAVDFVNLAVPGYSLFQEARQFEQMAVTEDPPDLAVFYDGANELALQVMRNNAGRGSDESPASYMEEQMEVLFRINSLPSRILNRGNGSAPAEPNTAGGPMLDAPDVADHAMNRYQRQIGIARSAAAEHHIPTLFLWQPTMSTAPRAAVAEFHPMTPQDWGWWRRLVDAARSRMPAEVVDLSDAMDSQTTPIFPDWAHTNRTGSRVVAAALVPRFEDLLRSGVGG